MIGGRFTLEVDIATDAEGSMWRLLAIEQLREDSQACLRSEPPLGGRREVQVAAMRVGPEDPGVTRERLLSLMRRAVPQWEA